MRVVHLLEWPAPGAGEGGQSGASAAAHVAAGAVARRGDLEHLVFVLGPSAARRWVAEAGLPGPVVQMAPPMGTVAIAGPALGRAVRAARPDLIQAWSPAAGAVARRVRPAGVRVCAAGLATGASPGRWLRAAPAIDALVTPCGQTAQEARRAEAAARVIETGVPRLEAPRDHGGRASAREALRRRLGLADRDRVALLVGDGADATRLMVACALTGASGRAVCALLPHGAGAERRALRTFERSKAMLDCRLGRAPWTQLAVAADIGMIVEDGDVAVATALSVAMGLGLPVIAPAPVYGRLGVQRADAGELVGAAWTRAELARLAGPLLDEPELARRALERAQAVADRAREEAGGTRDFFAALDEVWEAAGAFGRQATASHARTITA
jgi:hypothetical protein